MPSLPFSFRGVIRFSSSFLVIIIIIISSSLSWMSRCEWPRLWLSRLQSSDFVASPTSPCSHWMMTMMAAKKILLTIITAAWPMASKIRCKRPRMLSGSPTLLLLESRAGTLSTKNAAGERFLYLPRTCGRESRALNEWCLFQLKALQLITQPHLEIAPIKCDDVCIHVFAWFTSGK